MVKQAIEESSETRQYVFVKSVQAVVRLTCKCPVIIILQYNLY